ncbi:MAG: acyl-CoA thioesterase [Deltaproteobacteria bacterium]|nr:acyl-CoA thioesterase [Candidatus Zymogenaceae bacterium]
MASRAERTKDDRAEFRFKTSSRVMMSHTDQEGIVNNISFFIYLEAGRFEYFRSLGLSLTDIKKQGIGMAMVESSCAFLSPLFFDDIIEIFARIDRLGNSSFRMRYLVFVPERGVIAARGLTVSVFTDTATRTVRPIPPSFRDTVIAYEGGLNVQTV